MSEAAHLASQLVAFASSHDQPWFDPLDAAISGLDAEAAAVRPNGMNSVWAVVDHVSFWLDLVARRLERAPTADAEASESGWSIPATGSDDDWQKVIAELHARVTRLAGVISTLTDEELAAEWAPGRAPRWQVVHGVINHLSYHTADIMAIRQIGSERIGLSQ